ncbi:MAG: hypothetical protein QM753_18280 [Thermomicrobiales bacterium]
MTTIASPTSRFDTTPASEIDDLRKDAPVESRDDTPSPLVQALPLLLSVVATLALTLAFVAGQWLASGSSGLA